MPILKRSPHYRTDLLFARYVASPITAVTHLLAGAGLAVVLHQRPAVELVSWWWVFLLVPGVWLLFGSLIFLVHLTLGAFGSPETYRPLGESLVESLLCREALALVVTMVLGHAAIGWSQEGAVSQERFQNCVKGLREPGLRALAKSMAQPVKARDFSLLCYKAYQADAELKPTTPTSPEDLVKRYGQ